MEKTYILDARSRYMCLDINNSVPGKKIIVWENGKMIYELTVYLAEPGMDSVRMYADMRPFLGKELSFTIAEAQTESPYVPVFTDKRVGERDYNNYLRPQVHYTSRYGWLNDPNGMIYACGRYHMFYQHNPAGTRWGNMHWCHAVSTDLLHWEEKEEALYPDEHGLMFSGSAILDKGNVTGLQEGDVPPILLYYTAAGGDSRVSRGQRYAQFLAYSTDGGETFRKYSDTPVVPFYVSGNRDPKVVWADELGAWVMALYMEAGEYRLFISKNLLNWEFFQSFKLPNDTECPDFYPLNCVETGERLWVFIGAADQYLVGKLTNGGFAPVADARHYRLGGRGSYAAQSFSGLEGKVVRMAWGQMDAPGAEFNSQMLIPTEVTLHRSADGQYLLATNPIDDFAALRLSNICESKTVSADSPAKYLLNGKAYDLTIRIPYDSAAVQCDFYGITVKIDPKANLIMMPGREIPLTYNFDSPDRVHDVRMIVDTISLEVFADQGKLYTAIGVIADMTKNELTITTADDGEKNDVALDISSLDSIWQ